MSKTYDKLWVFGDSFTTPDYCVSARDSFWGLTAQNLNIPEIINYSKPGNSVDTVEQLLIGSTPEINWSKDLLFIGLPPLERITIFDNFKDTKYIGHVIDTTDWTCSDHNVLAHNGLECLQNYGSDQLLIIHSDRSWLETQILRTIFLLTQWLDSVGARYLILNLSKDLDENNHWGPSNFVLPYCKNHKNCILFKDTYHGINVNINKPADFDKFGWNGHHGPNGNKYFFEQSLLPRLKELNLC